MARQSSFPPIGFLVLGVLSLAASILFIVRAAAIEKRPSVCGRRCSSERLDSSGLLPTGRPATIPRTENTPRSADEPISATSTCGNAQVSRLCASASET